MSDLKHIYFEAEQITAISLFTSVVSTKYVDAST